MRIPIKKLSGKVGFVAAVALAAVVGGATTAFVSAAIPNEDGSVSTCYRNNASLLQPKGAMRVIDDASENCASGETALNISQGGDNLQTAYFRIKNGAADTAAMRNITAYEHTSDGGGYCIQVAFEPNIAISGLPNATAYAKNTGENAASEINTACTNSVYNAFVQQSSSSGNTVVWFSE